ncbi:MAG: DDE domain-containing protein, partial [Chitinophagaceae bacterium]
FELNGRFCYLTFIIDAFSRRIVGHHTSSRLLTDQTTLPALKMALRKRKWIIKEGLIFHSDGGGQYYDKEFLNLTRKYQMANSMCEFAWENGKAERINGVIKNNYLKHRKIRTFNDLVKEVDRSVKLYNFDKPHIGLQRLTPIKFEDQLSKVTLGEGSNGKQMKLLQIIN